MFALLDCSNKQHAVITSLMMIRGSFNAHNNLTYYVFPMGDTLTGRGSHNEYPITSLKSLKSETNRMVVTVFELGALPECRPVSLVPPQIQLLVHVLFGRPLVVPDSQISCF